MKGGRTPIHIMRFAPSDYVNDPAVKLALKRGDLEAAAFYPMFLFHSFIQGGSLPANVEALAAVVGMSEGQVERAVAFWKAQGKLVEADGLLFQKRVMREIRKELSYRKGQQELGRFGGRPPKLSYSNDKKGHPLENPKGSVFGPESPPAPAPSPAPLPAPAPNVGTEERAYVPPDVRAENSIRASRVVSERRLLGCVQQIAERTNEDPPAVMRQVTAYKNRDGATINGRVNPALLSDERLEKSLADAEAWLADLENPK